METKIIEIEVNPNWTYKQAVDNLKALKDLYQGQLASFSLWQTREWARFVRTTRDKFYTLNLLEWQIDNLWNCMNGFKPLSHIKVSAERYK